MVTSVNRRGTGFSPIGSLVALAIAAITAAPALGQGPGGGPGGGPGFGGGRGGRMGGMVVGTIRQIDPNRSAVQVQTTGPEADSRWIVVSPQATISRQVQGKLAELKPNDTIVVTGVPVAIQATQIQVGEMPPVGFGGGGGFGGPGGGPGGPARGGQGPGGGPGGGQNARATGTVVTTSPLVVMLPGNVRLTVTADASTRITRVVKTSLAELKVGETLLAMGQPDDNGNVVAMRVEVGIDPNSAFGGGFGGGIRRRPDGGGGQP